jgi:hypothetical protein
VKGNFPYCFREYIYKKLSGGILYTRPQRN